MDEEFKAELGRRRAAIVEQLKKDGERAGNLQKKKPALLLFSAPVYLRNGDVEHTYRQHSDFFYLTGLEEPECALLLLPDEPGFVLFVREKDREREIWDGLRTGTEGACRDFGATEAHPIGELEEKLPDYLENRTRLHYLMGTHDEWDKTVFKARRGVQMRRRKRVDAPSELVDARLLLHETRVKKTEFERRKMADAGRLSADAHRAAMAASAPGKTEWDLQTVIESEFRKAGARRVAYDSIVGSGQNATILHYRENDQMMSDGDLVLIDAGAEFDYLAADITRTFPVNGKFSPVQRRLYDIVLKSQLAALDATKIGATMDDVHDAAVEALAAGLREEGLLGDAEGAEAVTERVRRFYMHKTSHFLGMDVHDVGAYHQNGELRRLEAGMVITIEPGLYFAKDDETVPEDVRGIGIRIEDDVLITEDGIVNLTESCPKTVTEIEAACAGSAP